MLTVFCALYEEAKPLIKKFNLKQEALGSPFPLFSCEEGGLRLVLTGVGEILAASAVSFFSALFSVEKEDVLLNYGMAAGDPGLPENCSYLCNKITEKTTGKTFYPDMLYNLPLKEAEVVTVSRVIEKAEMTEEPILYDMEAAGIYQAGLPFYGTDRMLFIKTVSDYGVEGTDKVQPKETATTFLYDIIERFVFQKKDDKIEETSRQELRRTEDFRKLSEELFCSKTMEEELLRLLYYLTLAGTDSMSFIKKDRETGVLPCKNKREGKKYLERIKDNLL